MTDSVDAEHEIERGVEGGLEYFEVDTEAG